MTKIKKILYFTVAIAVAIAFTSCEDRLDVKSDGLNAGLRNQSADFEYLYQSGQLNEVIEEFNQAFSLMMRDNWVAREYVLQKLNNVNHTITMQQLSGNGGATHKGEIIMQALGCVSWFMFEHFPHMQISVKGDFQELISRHNTQIILDDIAFIHHNRPLRTWLGTEWLVQSQGISYVIDGNITRTMSGNEHFECHPRIIIGDCIVAPGSVNLHNIPMYDGMLMFHCFPEFLDAMHQLSRMEESERLLWEASMGFQSWETVSMEYYAAVVDNLDFNQFNSDADVIAFINNHHGQVLLIENNIISECEIEKLISVRFAYLPERFVMDGNNNMYIIGNTVFKHIILDNEEFEIAAEATASNINTLQGTDDNSAVKLKNNADFDVYNPIVAATHPTWGPQLPPNTRCRFGWFTRQNGNYRTSARLTSNIRVKRVLFCRHTFGIGVKRHYFTRINAEIVNEEYRRRLGFLWRTWIRTYIHVHGRIDLEYMWIGRDFNSPNLPPQLYVGHLTESFDINRSIRNHTFSRNRILQLCIPTIPCERPHTGGFSNFTIDYNARGIGRVSMRHPNH